MTKKARKRKISNKDKISRFFEEMEWMFGVNNHERIIAFKKEDCENEDGDSVTAEITYDEEYQRVKISIYPTFLKCTLAEQRKMLLHELCHIITLPSKTRAYAILDGQAVTKNELMRINEKATSQVENLLHNLLKGNLRYAVKAYNNYLE